MGRLVVQYAGSNEGPIQIAGADDSFLAILVLIHFAQHQWVEKPVVEEAAVTLTVAGSHAGDGNQSADAFAAHGAHERLRRGGEEGHFLEGTHGRAE